MRDEKKKLVEDIEKAFESYMDARQIWVKADLDWRRSELNYEKKKYALDAYNAAHPEEAADE